MSDEARPRSAHRQSVTGLAVRDASKSTTSVSQSRRFKSTGTSLHDSRSSVLSPEKQKEREDILYKMSKKIAQLTKVVYYLNTKNEDAAVEMDALVRQHEEELTKMVNDAKMKHSALEEKLSDEQDEQRNEMERVVEEERQRLSTARESISAELETLRKETAEKEEQRRAETAATVAMYQEQVKTLNQQLEDFKSNQSDSLKNIEQLQKEYEDREALLKKEHQDVVDKLNQEHGEIVSTLEHSLSEQKEASALVEQQFKTELESIREELDNQKSSSAQKISDLETALETQAKQATERFEIMQKQFKTAIAEGQSTIKDQASQIQKLNGEKASLSITISQLKTQLSENEKQVAAAQDKLKEALEDVKLRQDQLTIAESKAMEAEMQCHEVTRQLNDAKRMADIADQKLSDKNKELEQHKAVLEERDIQLKTIRAEVDKLVQLRDEQQGKLTSYETMLTTKEKNIQSLTSIISGLKKTAAKRLDQEKARITQEIEMRLGEEIRNHRGIIEAIHKDYQALLDKSKSELDETVKRTTEERHALLESMAADKKRVEEDQKKIAEILKEDATKRALIAKYEEELEFSKGQIVVLERDKSVMYQELLELGARTREEARRDFDIEKKALIEKMKEEHAKKVDEIIVDMKALSDRQLANMREQSDRKHEAELENIMHQQRIVLEQKDEEKLALMEVLNQKDLECDKKVWQAEDEKEATLKELEAAKLSHKDEIDRLSQKFEADIQALNKRLVQEKDDAIDALNKQYTLKVDTLSEDHVKEIQNMIKAHADAIATQKKNLDDLREQTINDLQLAHRAEMFKLRDTHQRELLEKKMQAALERSQALKANDEKHEVLLQSKVKEIDQLLQQIDELEATYSEANNMIKKRNEQIATYEQDILELNHDLSEAKNILEESLTKLEQALVERQRAEIEEIQKTNLAESQRMFNEFQQAQLFFKKQINELNKKLEEAEIRYINREPRQVDLERIASLENDVKQNIEKIHALEDELAFYRLELGNREDSLNRIFNARPNVGTMSTVNYLNNSKKMRAKLENINAKLGTRDKLPPLLRKISTDSVDVESRPEKAA